MEASGKTACTPGEDRFLGPVRRVDLRVRDTILEAETMYQGEISAFDILPEKIKLFPGNES